MNYQQLLLKKCNKTDLDSILKLQDIIFDGLENPSILRRNTESILTQCLEEPNITIGVYDQSDLIGVIILVEPTGEETDLRKNLKCHTVDNAADFKLIMIKKEYRGYGLQRSLMWILEKIAYIRYYKFLCVSVSPYNEYSKRNIIKSGYEFDHQECLYGGLEREIYVKELRVDNYNAGIINSVCKFEGKRDVCFTPDLTRCFKGTISIATTGDVLEYYEKNTGKSYFGLYIKKFTPFVLLYDINTQKWTVFEYSDNINGLILKNVWLNSTQESFWIN